MDISVSREYRMVIITHADGSPAYVFSCCPDCDTLHYVPRTEAGAGRTGEGDADVLFEEIAIDGSGVADLIKLADQYEKFLKERHHDTAHGERHEDLDNELSRRAGELFGVYLRS